jgi:hypothetical protein
MAGLFGQHHGTSTAVIGEPPGRTHRIQPRHCAAIIEESAPADGLVSPSHDGPGRHRTRRTALGGPAVCRSPLPGQHLRWRARHRNEQRDAEPWEGWRLAACRSLWMVRSAHSVTAPSACDDRCWRDPRPAHRWDHDSDM